MDILNIIKSRRSIRRFRSLPVDEEIVEKVLEAGRWAPSGLNNQPWRFAVITDSAMKARFEGLTRYSRIVRSAACLIAVFLDRSSSYDRTKDIQAAGACIQNMLLETHSLGLGAVWLGEILKSRDEINVLLGLKEELELMAVLALGYPDEIPKAPNRKGLRELIVYKT